MKIIPDFVCIGGQFSGADWVHKHLGVSEGVFVPFLNCKALLSETPAWDYQALYLTAAPEDLLGDVSPAYSAFETVPETLFAINKDARVIFMINEPVNRAFSQYEAGIKNGRIERGTSFFSAFESNLGFMKSRGEYVKILESYVAAGFDKRRILVLDQDLIKSNVDRLLQDLSEFLGIRIKHNNSVSKAWLKAQTKNQPDENDRAKMLHYYKNANQELREYITISPNWL